MLKNKKLVIINNESVSQTDNKFYCDNIEMKSLPEGLNESFDVSLIVRKSKLKRSHSIKLTNVKAAKNIFIFLYRIFQTFKNKKVNYLIISITPYTFFSYLILFFFRKKIFLYLRSNGYEEWKAIIGFLGPFLYHILYSVVMYGSSVISCQERLTKNKEISLVYPSELDDTWTKNISEPNLEKPKLLYIGRIKIEKGVFSLFNIFNKIQDDIVLSVVGKVEDKEKINNEKINFIDYEHDPGKLIEIYDNHNISILPSFTEAHPKVLDESLARLRPIIIFKDIEHVINNKKGIFVSQRDPSSLKNTINYIIQNYMKIQKEMSKNILPTKKNFISEMAKILN